MLQKKNYKRFKKAKFKLENDLSIQLYTDKAKTDKPNEFYIEFSKNLKIMEDEILDLKYKRKFNKSLLLEKYKGLLLAKNVEMQNVKKNNSAWLNIDEHTNISFDGKSYNLETSS